VTRRSSVVSLRRSIPLRVAVLGLLGPAAAQARGPAPDPAGANAAPAPDPAPTAPTAATRTTVRTTRPPASIVVAPAGRAGPVRTATRAPRTIAAPRAKHAVRRAPVHRRSRIELPRVDVPLVDVQPLRVDVPRGLGVAARSLHDDTPALAAGIALLVATVAAAAGALLALVAARAPGEAT
jgi:hypothetical protein